MPQRDGDIGSVRLTLDNNGTAFSGATYDPWGSPERGSVGTFGFTGELQQGDNVYLRARWYNAGSGTFTSKDPFEGYSQQPYSLHPYQYAYSNPVLWTDPSGRCVPEWVPFVGEDGCTLGAGIGQGQLDVDGFQEYSADVVQGMGILGAVVVDAVAGTNGTQQILDDAGPGTYLGMAAAALAMGSATAKYGEPVATQAAIRGQLFVQSHPQLIPWLTAAGLLANTSDDLLMWWSALCNDPFAANEIYTAQYLANSDGQAPFGDILATSGLLWGRYRGRLRANPPGQQDVYCYFSAVAYLIGCNAGELKASGQYLEAIVDAFPNRTTPDGKQLITPLREYNVNHYAVRNPDGTITDPAVLYNLNEYRNGRPIPPEAERLLKMDTFTQKEHDLLMNILLDFIQNPVRNWQ
jgi:RHS repeat-associated protein